MRPVLFKLLPTQKEIKKGHFHKWGTELLEARDGNHTFTVGIIEDESGKVHNVFPEYIRFIDKPLPN